MAAGEAAERLEIAAIRHRALRIGRRGEVAGDGARQQRLVERGEIGQEVGRARCRQVDRLATCGQGAGRISRVERVGDQHRGQSSRLAGARGDPALGGDGGEKQALARAVEHQDFAVGIERARQRVAAAEPGRDRAAEFLDALVGRIAAEVIQVRGQHRPDKSGNRVLRLADREIDGGLAGRDAGDQLGQPHERRAAIDRRSSGRGRLALGGHHGHWRRARSARDTRA